MTNREDIQTAARPGRKPLPEHQERQLLKTARIFGYWVRVYYLVHNDSFFLEWNLPGDSSGCGSSGAKSYLDSADCNHSWNHCLAELMEKFGAEVKVLPLDAPRVAHPVELKRIT